VPPTLSQFRVKVARDLRDPNMRTFTTEYVNDLINAGLEEVSRVYPQEVIQVINRLPSTYSYGSACSSAFRAEWWKNGKFHALLPANDQDNGSITGWDLWAGQFLLPTGTVDSMAAGDQIRLWGYQSRPQLVNDNAVAATDDTAEWGVRRYARSQAFALMQADRALFKQWQAASTNTDVSSNMLGQMVGLYASEWDRTRNYLRRLRRQ